MSGHINSPGPQPLDLGYNVLFVALAGFALPFCFPLAWYLGNEYLERCSGQQVPIGAAGRIGRGLGKGVTMGAIIILAAVALVKMLDF